MKISIAQANEYGRRVLMAQGVPEDIARDVAEHWWSPTASATPATACRS